MISTGKSKLVLSLIMLTALFSFCPISYARETLTIGKSQTFTQFDYHIMYPESDPNNASLPMPSVYFNDSSGNNATVALGARNGEAGVARAFIGITFDVNPGEFANGNYTKEEVMRWPITIELNFSYSISANWVQDFGSANAGVGIPHLSSGWYAFIGYEVGAMGSHSETVTATYTITLDQLEKQLGNKIWLEVYSQAHTVFEGPNKVQPSWRHYSSSSVTLHSIKITFNCDFSIKPGIERCFGGWGNQCQSLLSFEPDQNTCKVKGDASVGSVLHDWCCYRHGEILACPSCLIEGALALEDLTCNRLWKHTWGPYFDGIGDDTNQYIRAPSGAHVLPDFEFLCQSGQCTRKSQKSKKPIIYRNVGPLNHLCTYCICE